MKTFTRRIVKDANTILILGIVIRILAVILSPEIGDSHNAHTFGDIFWQTGSIYSNNQVLYPYPPLLAYYLGFSAFLSSKLHIPFVYIFKIPPVLADICLLYVLKRIIKKPTVLLYYALNPIAIVTSSVFGKEDAFVILFAFLAYLVHKKGNSFILSAVLLGLSFWIKTFTILLLPLFLLRLPNLKTKLTFSLIMFIPYIGIVLPYVITDFANVHAVYFSYSGVVDYGWLAIIKAGSAILSGTSINFTPIDDLLPAMLHISKYVFISAYILFLFRQYRSKTSLNNQIILVFLLFYIVYGGIGTNFLFWIVPFLLLSDFHSAKSYSIAGSLAIICYILTQLYEPVLKYIPVPFLRTPTLLSVFYFVSLALFWILLIKVFYRIYHYDNNK